MSRQPNKPPAGESQNNGRNEYIPSFISKAPFYATGTDEDYLEHQRLQSLPTDTLDKAKWYARGAKAAPAATKFRKGACENCGAMTHKTKECLSRPRKAGAKWTGKDIQADEVVADVKLGWDAKRDRWNGYDAREYGAVVAEYEELEAAKKKNASAAKAKPEGDDKDNDTESPAADDANDSDARYAEETDMGRNQPTSTRQLRLREDTAKYLLNLDLESTRYDPKTRSMATLPPSETTDADDGFVRPAETHDDASAFERAQRYAWETQEGPSATTAAAASTAGAIKKLHLQANPTEGEAALRAAATAAAAKKAAKAAYLAAQYGDSAAAVASSLLTAASSEVYVEYDEKGNVKDASSKNSKLLTTTLSKYPEDIFPQNHTSVWGSWWADFKWGYACCRSLVRNSYCTGEEGRRLFEEAEGRLKGEDLDDLIDGGGKGGQGLMIEEQKSLDQEDEKMNNGESRSQETKQEKGTKGAKKRTAQELRDGITEEEMEGYKRSRVDENDPMAKLLGTDELAS